MSVTLELKPETEERAAREAAARGVPVETLLAEVIEQNLNGAGSVASNERLSPEERRRRFVEWLESREYITATPLSDEAVSREEIYREREDSQL